MSEVHVPLYPQGQPGLAVEKAGRVVRGRAERVKRENVQLAYVATGVPRL